MGYNYFNSISQLKGFPNDSIILSSQTSKYNETIFKMSSLILDNPEYVNSKIEKNDFNCDFLFENRLIQPILNLDDKKIIKIIKEKNLDENNPEDILKLLNAIRSSLTSNK